MKIRYGKWLAAPLVLALASGTWFALAQEKQEPKVESANVAVVNGTAITQEEFDRDMAIVQQRMSGMGKTPSEKEMGAVKKEVLENLINMELLYQESQKQGMKVDEASIDEQMQSLKKRFPSEAAFNLALSKKGLTESAVKEQIGRGLAIQKLVDKKFENLAVSKEETKQYYESNKDLFKKPEQIRASHILVKVEPEADASKKAEARKKIEEIQKKLENGADFATLAKEFSEGPSNKKGGDLGFFSRGQMVKPFEEAAFALQPGQMSGIVETPYGYHLIKVTDRKPESAVPYEEIKEKLQKYLKENKMKAEVGQYIASLKEKAKIERIMTVQDQ